MSELRIKNRSEIHSSLIWSLSYKLHTLFIITANYRINVSQNTSIWESVFKLFKFATMKLSIWSLVVLHKKLTGTSFRIQNLSDHKRINREKNYKEAGSQKFTIRRALFSTRHAQHVWEAGIADTLTTFHLDILSEFSYWAVYTRHFAVSAPHYFQWSAP